MLVQMSRDVLFLEALLAPLLPEPRDETPDLRQLVVGLVDLWALRKEAGAVGWMRSGRMASSSPVVSGWTGSAPERVGNMLFGH